MTNTTQIRLLVSILAVAGGGLVGAKSLPTPATSAASPQSMQAATEPGYGWPVKPFDRQHPVRGNFGDPRTVFAAPPTRHGLLTGSGDFTYHRGIDISAPDGTAVYPVRSGRVTKIAVEEIVVDGGDGHSFEYWHLVPRVAVGEHVDAQATVLGTIMRGAEHVHLSELRSGVLVNPLAPGHLGPYVDASAPHVNLITFRRRDAGDDLMPECLRGSVELVAAASDTPSMPVPGIWRSLPVSPAEVTFHIASVKHPRSVVPETVAVDVRYTLPGSTDAMWKTYARGTRMNMSQFGLHRFWFQPGVYLFKLTHGPFNTRRLPDGAYALTVTARDTAGNTGSATQVFTVQNHGRTHCA